MKLSDLELSAYDLVVIALPGALALTEIGITIYGSNQCWSRLTHISLSGAIAFGFASFAVGHLTNQAAYECSTLFGRVRTIRRPRDQFWKQGGERICLLLKSRANIDISPASERACDRAFNHCLTMIGDSFGKRQVFSLVAALSLSLAFLCITAIIPALHMASLGSASRWRKTGADAAICGVCLACASLAWRRAQLYFSLADVTVFDIFEATINTDNSDGTDNPESYADGTPTDTDEDTQD